MGRTRTYTLKLRTQCRTCGELHETTCSLGHNTLCKRQNVKKCQDYRRPSVLEAAVQLATVAGIDLATLQNRKEKSKENPKAEYASTEKGIHYE